MIDYLVQILCGNFHSSDRCQNALRFFVVGVIVIDPAIVLALWLLLIV